MFIRKKLSFFHLIINALFKSLLFIYAGNIIHNLGEFQGLSFIKEISCLIPFSCSCINISNCALCGFPFISGFYSQNVTNEIFPLHAKNIFSYIYPLSLQVLILFVFFIIYFW